MKVEVNVDVERVVHETLTIDREQLIALVCATFNYLIEKDLLFAESEDVRELAESFIREYVVEVT